MLTLLCDKWINIAIKWTWFIHWMWWYMMWFKWWQIDEKLNKKRRKIYLKCLKGCIIVWWLCCIIIVAENLNKKKNIFKRIACLKWRYLFATEEINFSSFFIISFLFVVAGVVFVVVFLFLYVIFLCNRNSLNQLCIKVDWTWWTWTSRPDLLE